MTIKPHSCYLTRMMLITGKDLKTRAYEQRFPELAEIIKDYNFDHLEDDAMHFFIFNGENIEQHKHFPYEAFLEMITMSLKTGVESYQYQPNILTVVTDLISMCCERDFITPEQAAGFVKDFCEQMIGVEVNEPKTTTKQGVPVFVSPMMSYEKH